MIRKDSDVSVVTKPEWKTILELITFTDVTKVFRIVRKINRDQDISNFFI